MPFVSLLLSPILFPLLILLFKEFLLFIELDLERFDAETKENIKMGHDRVEGRKVFYRVCIRHCNVQVQLI